MICANFALNNLEEPLIYALLRHDLTLLPHSVAIRFPCRNNSDKNQANFLELAPDHCTFASVI